MEASADRHFISTLLFTISQKGQLHVFSSMGQQVKRYSAISRLIVEREEQKEEDRKKCQFQVTTGTHFPLASQHTSLRSIERLDEVSGYVCKRKST